MAAFVLDSGLKTGGALFNRKDPKNAAGEVVPILSRDGVPKKGAHNYIFNGGRDVTGLANRHRFKMRIPPTSVTRKVGDCGCFGVHPTAAQWLWMLNLVCFFTHSTMCVVVAYFAWWSKDLSKYEEDPYTLTIYRISAKWDNSTTQGYEINIEDNGMGFNLAWGTLFFFLISAVFHLLALVFGLFESTWSWYWRQIDDAFCWWRWLEYSMSASLMAILLAITIGIREENTLACFFVLVAVTQSFGFLTELYSRPVISKDAINYKTPIGRRGFVGAPDYEENPNALNLISQTTWEGERIIRSDDDKLVVSSLDFLHAQRCSNWVRRLVPYLIGIFPFVTWVVLCTFHLENSKRRLYEETSGDLVIPAWINGLLYGTFLLFSSFSFVLPLFQYLPPGFYFGSEICYSLLSMSSKLFLGVTILVNVIMAEGRAEDLLGVGGLETGR